MTQAALSTAMACRIMSGAGMGQNAIVQAFASLQPMATMDGAKYWSALEVSRTVKRYATPT